MSDRPQRVHALDELAEDAVTVVEVRRGDQRDEKLTAVGVGPAVRHGEDAGFAVAKLWIELVGKREPGTAHARAFRIAALNHEAGNDAAQENVGELTGHYSREAAYRQLRGGRDLGAYFCVGGPSVFYGGVSLRFREQDFEVDREIVGDSGARWPLRYADLEPYYTVAERILGVTGVTGEDPTEPRRSEPYPFPSADLAPVTRRIASTARDLEIGRAHV